MKKLLLGDEAIALGAINAGLSGVYAYPGTPSTEIPEYIQNDPLAKERGIHSRWCTNEKTAMEAALGMSYAGKRALVCMKHVGMNVCADAFVNSAITGVKGGLIVLAADDPSMHSSQNEQDSRFYAKFALVPCLEPSNQQEAYDMMAYGFDLSEKLGEPVVLRVVTRLAHSRAAVEVTEPMAENPFSPATDAWVLLPGIARKKYAVLLEKQETMMQASENSIYNKVETSSSKTGILACGIAYNYVKEAIGDDANLVKVSQYPLPEDKIKALEEELNLVASVIPYLINVKGYIDIDVELINKECSKQIEAYKERIINNNKTYSSINKNQIVIQVISRLKRIFDEKLSVRETEKLVKKIQQEKEEVPANKTKNLGKNPLLHICLSAGTSSSSTSSPAIIT